MFEAILLPARLAFGGSNVRMLTQVDLDARACSWMSTESASRRSTHIRDAYAPLGLQSFLTVAKTSAAPGRSEPA